MKQNINIVLQSRKKKRNKQKQNKQTKKQTKQNKTKKKQNKTKTKQKQNKTKQTGLKNHKNPKALIEYLNNMKDICGKINE